jgi:hypothetical protein
MTVPSALHLGWHISELHLNRQRNVPIIPPKDMNHFTEVGSKSCGPRMDFATLVNLVTSYVLGRSISRKVDSPEMDQDMLREAICDCLWTLQHRKLSAGDKEEL